MPSKKPNVAVKRDAPKAALLSFTLGFSWPQFGNADEYPTFPIEGALMKLLAVASASLLAGCITISGTYTFVLGSFSRAGFDNC